MYALLMYGKRERYVSLMLICRRITKKTRLTRRSPGEGGVQSACTHLMHDFATVNVVMVDDDRRCQEFSLPATLSQITHLANMINHDNNSSKRRLMRGTSLKKLGFTFRSSLTETKLSYKLSMGL